ncbi:MAG: hypothetical protein WC517_03720 [Patescibacteria group bacterium]
MPQGRILLKSISESRKLAELKTDSARLQYTWTLAHLDINGCFSADPIIIKGRIFTRLNKTIEEIEENLKDMEKVELIKIFQSNGDRFFIYPDFKEKQPHLNPEREAKSMISSLTLEQVRSKSGVSQDKLPLKLKVNIKDKYKDKEKKRIVKEKKNKPSCSNEQVPVVKLKIKKETCPEVKQTLDLWFQLHQDLKIGGYKVKPLIQGGKAGKHLERLIKALKQDEVWSYTDKLFMEVMKYVLIAYLTDKSDFLCKIKHDIVFFCTNFNTWWMPIKEMLWQQSKPVRSGSQSDTCPVGIGSIMPKIDQGSKA